MAEGKSFFCGPSTFLSAGHEPRERKGDLPKRGGGDTKGGNFKRGAVLNPSATRRSPDPRGRGNSPERGGGGIRRARPRANIDGLGKKMKGKEQL